MKTFNKTAIILLLALPLLLAGCKKDQPKTGYSNPNPAKDTPMYETILPEFTKIFQLCPNNDGTFYALASGKNTQSVLKIDGSGTVLNKKALSFNSRRCMVKIGESMMIVGNTTNGDKGMVAVVDPSLELVAMTVTEPNYKIDLVSLVQDSQDPTLFYAGGLARNSRSIQYPYICTIEYANGLFNKVNSKVFSGSDYEQCRIVGMVEKNLSGQKDLIVEMIHYTVADQPNNDNACVVHIAKLNYFEEEWGWAHSTWDVAIEGPHGDSYTGNNSIDSDDENIYFFGYCNDDKTPAPGNGGYWSSGFVAAVNWRDGREIWKKVVSFTNKDDSFLDGLLLDGCLYVCGGHSGLYYNTTKNSFYNGLVAKLSMSGELLAYKAFGDSQRDSEFIHFVKDLNGNLVCVGLTGENADEGQLINKGWFLKTDLFTNSTKLDAPDFSEKLDEELGQCCSPRMGGLDMD